MNNSKLFGTVRKNIFIGVALILLGLLTRSNFFAELLPSSLRSFLFSVGEFMNLFLVPLDYYYQPHYFLLDILGWMVVATGIVTVVVGIRMFGGQRGWWGRLSRLDEDAIKAMKIAALVVGILGSVVTFFVSVFVVALGGLGSAISGEGIFVLIGWLVVLSSVLALVGAILTRGMPGLGAKMMGIAAIPSILFTLSGVGMFFGLGTLLLVIASALAFIASRQTEVEPRRPLMSGVVEEGGSS